MLGKTRQDKKTEKNEGGVEKERILFIWSLVEVSLLL